MEMYVRAMANTHHSFASCIVHRPKSIGSSARSGLARDARQQKLEYMVPGTVQVQSSYSAHTGGTRVPVAYCTRYFPFTPAGRLGT